MKKLLLLIFVTGLILQSNASAKELVYWSVWNEPEPQAMALKKIFQKYEKANPGIKIKPVWNGRQSLVKLRSYLAAGKKIDLFDGDADNFLGLVLKENLAADLKSVTNKVKGNMLPNTWEIFQVKGKQYALPYVHNSIMFFYSKQAFKSAGIKKTPKTWKEFLNVCQALKKADYSPIAVEGNVDFYQYYFSGYLLNRLAGKDFIVKAVTDKTGKTWRDPSVRKMIALSRELWDRGYIPPESKGYQWPAAQNNIAAGDTAMELVGSWLPTELGNSVEPGFQWGAFAFPTVPDGKNKMDIMLAMMVMGVYSKSQNTSEAQDLLGFVLSVENQKTMADMARVGVVRKGVAWDPGIADAVKVVETSSSGFITDGVSTIYPDYVSKTLRPTASKAFMGQITADQFVEIMVKKTREYWKNK